MELRHDVINDIMALDDLIVSTGHSQLLQLSWYFWINASPD